MKKYIFNRRKSFLGAFILTTGLLCSCIDLEETYYSSVSPARADPATILGGVIGQLRGLRTTNANAYLASEYVYFLEISSDEVITPTRQKTDWYDGGKYIELQKHTWTPANGCILSAWDYGYNLVSNCNNSLKQAEEYGYSDNVKAQLRVLRAFAYSELLNNFGNIPLNLRSGEQNTNSRKEDVYRFLISELTDDIMDNLPRTTTGQMNQAIRYSLLARLYLNSKVYLNLDNGDNQYNLNLDSCIAACEKVEALNKYSVSDNVFDNFTVNNETSRENIFTVSFDGITTTGNYLPLLSYEHSMGEVLGVNQALFGDCVNGMCVNPGKTADDPDATFNIFDKDNDSRFLSILWGQQYKYNTADSASYQTYKVMIDGEPVFKPYFTTYAPYFNLGIYGDVGSILNARAYRGDGARIMKYELTVDQMWEMANDWVIIRFTEVKYMKAECLIRLGRSEEARPIFQEVLDTRGYDKSAIAAENFDVDGKLEARYLMNKSTLPLKSLVSIIPPTIDLEFMDKEWRREFIFEGHRRMTMIRMDKFLGTWGLKNDPDAADGHTLLFPIPTVAISNNTLLNQNPGYEGYNGWLN